jgi:hypothetical protein
MVGRADSSSGRRLIQLYLWPWSQSFGYACVSLRSWPALSADPTPASTMTRARSSLAIASNSARRVQRQGDDAVVVLVPEELREGGDRGGSGYGTSLVSPDAPHHSGRSLLTIAPTVNEACVCGNRDACGGDRSLQSEFGEARYSRRASPSYSKEKSRPKTAHECFALSRGPRDRATRRRLAG